MSTDPKNIQFQLVVKERRNNPRRQSDKFNSELYKTFSSQHCKSCLDKSGDIIMLLSSDMRVLYTTSNFLTFFKNKGALFTLSPRFSLFSSKENIRFKNFFYKKNKPSFFQLIVTHTNDQNITLLSCLRLSDQISSQPDVAHCLIKFKSSDHYQENWWKTISQQFSLTNAEIKLCSALISGKTLNEFCRISGISQSTARTQLNSIFTKTFTKRQSDLMRLIILLI